LRIATISLSDVREAHGRKQHAHDGTYLGRRLRQEERIPAAHTVPATIEVLRL
jgi:hypothetical protein